MKRAVFLLLVLLPAASAFAFNPHARGNRIALLATAGNHESRMEARAASLVRAQLVLELRRGGLDAFETRAFYDDVLRGERNDADYEADYYVELVRGHGTDQSYGGVGVAGRHGGVEMGVVVSHVAAGVRLYDGRTLELIDEFDVDGRDRGVAPTAIGIGGHHLGLWVNLPVMRGARQRSAAREAARDAARRIAESLGTEDSRR